MPFSDTVSNILTELTTCLVSRAAGAACVGSGRPGDGAHSAAGVTLADGGRAAAGARSVRLWPAVSGAVLRRAAAAAQPRALPEAGGLPPEQQGQSANSPVVRDGG